MEAAWKARQMYREVDERGRRKYSLTSLAEIFFCGETTMYRAVNALGPYRSLPEVKTEEALTADSVIALESLFANNPDLKAKVVDVGGGPVESALEKMKKSIAARNPEAMLNELTGRKDGTGSGS